MSEDVTLLEEEDAEEDGYNANSAQYVTAPPSGILSVHCKKIKHINESQMVVAEPELYLRIRVGANSKCTKTFNWTAGSKYVVVHEIKHFPLMVSRSRNDSSNEIRIDLVMVETAHVHRMIGHKDVHLYDMIKNLYVVGTYELKFRQNTIAALDFEICFAYGIFGYGYSHQLQNRQKKLEDIVSHSYLYRSEPPMNRKQSDNTTMAPVPIEHPDLISFAQKVQIGSPAVREMLVDRYSKYDMDVFSDLDKHEPVILARTMRRRLQKIEADFNSQTSRQQRKKFLEKLILRHGDDDKKHDKQNRDDRAPPGTTVLPDIDQVAAPEELVYGEDDDHTCVTDVPELSSFLANAPGIQVRGRAERSRRPSMSILLEDETANELERQQSTSEGASASMSGSIKHSDQQDRQISTGGNFMVSFANKLRLWKSKGAPAKLPNTGPVTSE
ncbi:C2 calcium-dependent domain-containing protein 6-like [Lytechinus variegatus]|uniref:C2 calcium-dependent domain-containing protein 6-like n=1 Tax=Lytechinus variegatus TaxID=7654 RepID=UPI001BB29BEC|nr:C2 calcium-dependent domain-containing protein 6-like [Lytechinus variegatus]